MHRTEQWYIQTDRIHKNHRMNNGHSAKWGRGCVGRQGRRAQSACVGKGQAVGAWGILRTEWLYGEGNTTESWHKLNSGMRGAGVGKGSAGVGVWGMGRAIMVLPRRGGVGRVGVMAGVWAWVRYGIHMYHKEQCHT